MATTTTNNPATGTQYDDYQYMIIKADGQAELKRLAGKYAIDPQPKITLVVGDEHGSKAFLYDPQAAANDLNEHHKTEEAKEKDIQIGRLNHSISVKNNTIGTLRHSLAEEQDNHAATEKKRKDLEEFCKTTVKRARTVGGNLDLVLQEIEMAQGLVMNENLENKLAVIKAEVTKARDESLEIDVPTGTNDDEAGTHI